MANDILERLRHRVGIYTKAERMTEFGELTYSYEKSQTVWAEITPASGRENTMKGDSAQVSVTHKITVRSGAIKKPRNDMFFEYKGQRYEVMYFTPHYRRNDLVEFYCKLKLEGDKDYGE